MSKTYTVTVEVKGAESGMDACEVVEWFINHGWDSRVDSLAHLDEEPEYKEEVERKLGCEVSVMGWVK